MVFERLLWVGGKVWNSSTDINRHLKNMDNGIRWSLHYCPSASEQWWNGCHCILWQRGQLLDSPQGKGSNGLLPQVMHLKPKGPPQSCAVGAESWGPCQASNEIGGLTRYCAVIMEDQEIRTGSYGVCSNSNVLTAI